MEIIDLPNVSVKNSSFSSNNTKFRDINTQALKAFIENEESYITREYETSYEPIQKGIISLVDVYLLSLKELVFNDNH